MEDLLKVNKKILPFSAIVGQDLLKEALILNAINQDLMGVIIKGERGTAKSMAVRAIAELLPEEEFSVECPYGCSPDPKQPHCEICQKIIDEGKKIRTERRKIRVITLPLSATEDKIVGSINIEKALKGHQSVFEPGLLAKANRGIIYIDEINLLDDNLVDILLDSAAMGFNIVEREGISIIHPSRFILVGTMNPEEGELRPQLIDRMGLYVEVKGIEDIEQRVKIIEIMEEFDIDSNALHERFKQEQEILIEKIKLAKNLLPTVKLQSDLKSFIAKICVDFGIDGHRADILIARCAKTIAAYEGRTFVERKDIEKAARFVIPHRVRRDPFDEEQNIEQKLQQIIQDQTVDNNNNNESNSNQKDIDNEQNSKEKNNEHHYDNSDNDNISGDDNINFSKPPAINKEQDNTDISNDSENKDKKKDNLENTKEYNFIVNSSSPEIKVNRNKKIKAGRGRRAKTLSNHSGKYIKARKPLSKTTDIAIDATIRQAVISKCNLNIGVEDIREKVREKKKAVTTVFIVDVSGSMGVGKRIEFAKSALLSMLRDAYQKRDKVGLVIFKGNSATIVLKPTSSIFLAQKKVKNIPTGGKTPLADGLLLGIKTILNEMIKDKNCIPVIVLISDGKANISKTGDKIKNEIIKISKKIKSLGINFIVIDADENKFKLGFIKDIVKNGNGKYFHLENLIKKDFKKTVGLNELF